MQKISIEEYEDIIDSVIFTHRGVAAHPLR
jgi:hypothetical protein